MNMNRDLSMGSLSSLTQATTSTTTILSTSQYMLENTTEMQTVSYLPITGRNLSNQAFGSGERPSNPMKERMEQKKLKSHVSLEDIEKSRPERRILRLKRVHIESFTQSFNEFMNGLELKSVQG